MKERVVITGMGIICPIGHDVETMWSNLLAGRSGMAPTTLFDASTYPTKFGAEVKEYDYRRFVKFPERHQHGNRGSLFAVGATVQACRQAGIETESESPKDGIDRRRLGVYLGAGEGPTDPDVFFPALVRGWKADRQTMDWAAWSDVAIGGMTAMRELEQEPNMPVGHVALLTGARGPIRSCLTACAASTQALGEAAMLIRRGRADIMISGGTHSMIHPLGVTGFNRLTALSTRNDSPTTASRPFSATRDGFVLGEGSAILILESLSSARRRGVKILAEVVGFGSSNDAFRVTDMHEEARGAVQAMRAALQDAGIQPNQIDYISTHGTSTAENDSIETLAIKKVFGDTAGKVAISSPKSVFGHLIGATGGAEMITCVLAIRDQIVPATMNLHDPDPALGLDYVPNQPRKMAVRTVLKESFGFGGQNNVVIVRDFAER